MKPLIMDYKICRENEDVVSYQYDAAEYLNIITVNGVKKPFIELDSADVELLTKTKTHRENDDDYFYLELATKTEVRRERDDPHDTFLELSTKTFVSRERDD